MARISYDFAGNNISIAENQIYKTLFNQVIAIQTYSENYTDNYSKLLKYATVDASQYGDTRLYIDTDALKSYEWGVNDVEARKLLDLVRPEDPNVQAIYLDSFRQIAVTVGGILDKMGFGGEGAFSQFNSTILGWIADTADIFRTTYYNSFIGTHEVGTANADKELNPMNFIIAKNGDENPALTASVALADLITDIKHVSRKYNELGFLRNFKEKDLIVVWNADFYNQLTYADRLVVFKDVDINKNLEFEVLPSDYFGTKVGTAHTQETVPATGVYRTLIEGDFTGTDGIERHLFPSQQIPVGAKYYKDEAYIEDKTIAFKVLAKSAVPFLSSFATSSVFVNERVHTQTHFYTFSYNTLVARKGLPFITVRFTEPAHANA
jgi:hypothetical protein